MKILVVEDNKINQNLLVAYLEDMNHVLDVVENGLEAVEAVTRQLYDVVLMDLNMPKMDGLSATANIRCLPHPNGAVPIIAVTANNSPESRKKAIEVGMNDYINKPIDRELLLHKIRNNTTLLASDAKS